MVSHGGADQTMSDLILALDIGGTKLAAGVASAEDFRRTGRLASIAKEPIPAPGTPQAVLPRAITLARELAQAAKGTIVAIGVSTGGPLDHTTGVVIKFPHLPGWRNIPLCRELSAALGAPALLDNDANLGALAEYRWGAGQGYDSMVYLTISTGIGGGVICRWAAGSWRGLGSRRGRSHQRRDWWPCLPVRQ
ncbi:MAG: hypothetical protein KatS3mg057_1869 [Herpetosiphonaceae bacterium]|nr:MAG: hypothetical protein KatS3mg057_1869 [Herpetosiphonaceae bacterium]